MKKHNIRKRFLALFVVLLMCLQPMLVHAANGAAIGSLKAKNITLMTEVAKKADEAKASVHIPKESYYNGKNKFGYDVYTPASNSEGVRVLVNGIALTKGDATSSVGAVLENGVRLILEKGYSLKDYKIVCADKYNCKIAEEAAKMNEANANKTGTASQTTKTNNTDNENQAAVLSSPAPSGKTLDTQLIANEKGEILITFDKKTFGHTDKESTYWLLLDVVKVSPAGAADKAEAGKTVKADAAAEDKAAETKADEGKAVKADAAAEDKAAEIKADEGKAVKADAAAETKADEGKAVKADAAAEDKAAEIKADEGKTVKADAAAEDKTAENKPVENNSGEDAEKTSETAVPEITQTPEPTPATDEKLSPYPSENPEPVPTKELAVSIIWEDADNQDGLRPNEIKFRLYADDKAVGEEIILSANNSWKHTIKDLPTKTSADADKDIVYTIKTAAVPAGYTEAIDMTGTDAKITYNHTLELADIVVQNVWNDKENQDGKRPSEVKVQLYANEKAIGEETVLSANNSWRHTFAGLDKYAAGKAVAYTIKVVSVPGGYTAAYTTAADGALVVTLTHEVEKTDIPVKITWSDSNNQDGIRPANAEVQLYADSKAVGAAVKVTADGEWKYTFEDVDVYAAGKKISYTVKAVNLAKGYTSSVKNTKGEWVITQSHTPEKINVTVEIKWDDDNNKTKERPTEVKLQLYANGAKQGSEVTVKSTASWKYTYNNLAKYKDGKEISYTVKQVNLSDKYKEYVKGHTITNVIATKVAAKTADHAQFAVWVSIMAVSVFCIAEIYFYKKRKRMC